MSAPLDVVPVSALTDPSQRFRCTPLRAVISAATCLGRQARWTRGAVGDPRGCTYFACTDCPLGRQVAQAVQIVGVARRAGRWWGDPRTAPETPCAVAGCDQPRRRVRPRAGHSPIHPDLAALCARHRATAQGAVEHGRCTPEGAAAYLAAGDHRGQYGPTLPPAVVIAIYTSPCPARTARAHGVSRGIAGRIARGEHYRAVTAGLVRGSAP